MSRRVPEFAILIGAVLGLSVVVTGITLGWGLYATVVVGALVSYPFVAFGIVRDTDPASTLRPRWLLGVGVVIAAAGALGVLLEDPTTRGVFRAVFVGLLLATPPAGYATHYGAGINPFSPRTTVEFGIGTSVALVGAGLFISEPLLGVAAGGLTALGSAFYGSARGVKFDARTKRVAAAIGALVGVGIAAAGVVTGGPLAEWLLVGAGVALVPSIYAALTAQRV